MSSVHVTSYFSLLAWFPFDYVGDMIPFSRKVVYYRIQGTLSHTHTRTDEHDEHDDDPDDDPGGPVPRPIDSCCHR
jgi:hypothetical protein